MLMLPSMMRLLFLVLMDYDPGPSKGNKIRQTDLRSPWFTRFSPDDIATCTFPDLENPYNWYTLLMSPPLTFITWLQKNKLLIDSKKCSRCNSPCSQQKRTSTIDGLIWCCIKCKSKPEYSIRSNSFFSGSHMYIQDIFNFVYNYLHK